MSANRILLRSVDLTYPASAFRERSLKSYLSGAFHRGPQPPEMRNIQALQKIDLEVKSGERVGLLGRNGAGKSTFLKMVAGLYPISGGSRTVDGDLRCLFDLSLGFEPDATGRENILYRGLLMGLRPSAVRRMEKEIVDFAELGPFIDYPLKTYSAGMQVRLAFSISTSLGGDILLMDEVIGAGDGPFMLKAKQRIHRLADRSEILVLASHDLGALSSLCTRGLVLREGELVFDGPLGPAIEFYQRTNGLPS